MDKKESQEQDKLKELIGSVEVSIPGGVWQELEKKRREILILGVIIAFLGYFAIPLWSGFFIFILLGPVLAIDHYPKVFRKLIVDHFLEFVEGVEADNTEYSGASGQLFNILKTAEEAFSLNTSGIEYEQQLCAEVDGWQANFCTFWKTTNDEHPTTLYWYQMLQISRPEFESEGVILIKAKEDSQIKGLVKKFTNLGVDNPVNSAGNLEEVKLISPEFNERFSVYADDQVSVRKFLTPAFMDHFASTAAKKFRALHIQGSTITMLSHGGFKEMKLLAKPPGIFRSVNRANKELILKPLKGGLLANLESHYKNVMRLRELLKI